MIAGIVTAVLLIAFLIGWAWAWSPRRREHFEAAARLALDDEPPAAPPSGESRR